MKVAVLMSSYNGEKYIQEQIESILLQTGEFQLDLIVRDDGSTDNTKKILEEYESQGKLRWFTGKNLKSAYSFLELMFECGNYDYYAFADQDDMWLPTKIAAGIQKMKDLQIPALYCGNAELVDAKLDSLGRMVYHSQPKADFCTLTCAGGLLGCTMIFNHPLMQTIRMLGKPTEGVVMHDFYLAVVCAAVNGKIIYDDTPYIKYRQHENNVVGVSYGKLGTIKDRLNSITQKCKVSISDQAAVLVRSFEKTQNVSKEYMKWLKKVACYRNNLITRIALACSGKTHYINKNKSLELRLTILFGNR